MQTKAESGFQIDMYLSFKSPETKFNYSKRVVLV